jgi:hypothetical protein
VIEIKKLNKYDTRAVVKITNWYDENVLASLKQYSTVDGEWFTREVFIGGKLHSLLESLQEEGKIKLKQLSSHHNLSEKERQIMQELDKA